MSYVFFSSSMAHLLLPFKYSAKNFTDLRCFTELQIQLDESQPVSHWSAILSMALF